ncbi:sigma 54-interacting transcriptional regulator [Robertkochia solimangrovi]|uniref:sigma 54-interacting transcriptional regulator n=1 Tax=Robertkochia solimangrovi TaxID=2213046 RepID=UPI00117E0F96|nr:sigma 54-interacting transcriptional regulator [Robertkochia solimangrovi]TRZ46110.1 hypothetical protein DMZ48_02265 [Robertkochia solimangrovi]
MADKQVNDICSFLSKTSLFAEVAHDSLFRFCEMASIITVDKGDVIFEKGDEGDTLYVILEGKVMIHDNTHIYGYLESGECFGEYAMIDRQRRSTTVSAAGDSKFMTATREIFMELMASDQGFSQGILSVLIKRHRDLDIIQEQLATSGKALENANLRMNTLINGAMDAILMFDKNFRIVHTNHAAESILENSDVLQRNILYFFDETSSTVLEEQIRDKFEKVAASDSIFFKFPLKVIGSNDTTALCEATLSKSGTDSETFYILILRSIEERLKNEDNIRLLTSQTQYLENEIRELTNNHGIIGEAPSMKEVIKMIGKVARTDANVLITGETGTGKELVARAIHHESHRNAHPLIRINCGAIPENLIESELFGHEKGAFTGAVSSRKGRFQLADKGTIFLDEIGELPLNLQPKLLRVIQEREFEPVGSSETIKIDVRIIAATHRDLLERSRQHEFREDLYYRLNVFPIKVPPLRDRGNDICLIANTMIAHYTAKMNIPTFSLSETDREQLLAYSWPGNVRELQNLVERAVILAGSGKVHWHTILPGASKPSDSVAPAEDTILTAEEMQALEIKNIRKALKRTSWRISGKNGAAALLNIPPTTLSSRMKALGISRPL